MDNKHSKTDIVKSIILGILVFIGAFGYSMLMFLIVSFIGLRFHIKWMILIAFLISAMIELFYIINKARRKK